MQWLLMSETQEEEVVWQCRKGIQDKEKQKGEKEHLSSIHGVTQESEQEHTDHHPSVVTFNAVPRPWTVIPSHHRGLLTWLPSMSG